MATRGFTGRRPPRPVEERLPPGQYLTEDFPVLQLGPTPRIDLARWSFTLWQGPKPLKSWNWEAFEALPRSRWSGDIHCVTKWSKLDTSWTGVSVDTLLDGVETSAQYVLAFSDGGYTTNLPLEDATGGKAWVAFRYNDEPLEPEHGGPARLLVPHLYFWKSAKWVRRLEITDQDDPGFWETAGYHNRGNPWLEERYWGD